MKGEPYTDLLVKALLCENTQEREALWQKAWQAEESYSQKQKSRRKQWLKQAGATNGLSAKAQPLGEGNCK